MDGAIADGDGVAAHGTAVCTAAADAGNGAAVDGDRVVFHGDGVVGAAAVIGIADLATAAGAAI